MSTIEFATQKEGLSFLGYVKGQEKFDLAKSAGITNPFGNMQMSMLTNTQPTNPFAPSHQHQMSMASIPMGQSLFTVNRA